MGYDELHITRRKEWSEAGHDITAEEWLAYIDKDPSFHSLQTTARTSPNGAASPNTRIPGWIGFREMSTARIPTQR